MTYKNSANDSSFIMHFLDKNVQQIIVHAH